MPVSISGAGSISGLDQGFNVTTGSVGVGTTNPRTDLQVGAFGGGDSNIQLATGTSGASNILFGDGSGGSDYYKGFIKYNHSTDNLELYTTDDLIHYTGGSERLRITSAGKVGIGTDDPKQFLSVVGRATFDQAGDYYGAWINGNSTADSSFNVGAWYNVGGRLRDNGNHVVLESMNTSHYVQLQPSGGNVGVGEDGPNVSLHITKDNDVSYTPDQATQNSNNQLKIENHSTTADSFVSMAMRSRACDFHLGVKNDGDTNAGRLFLVHQDTTNKEVVSITSAGNVGIGTENPGHVLDLYNSSGTDCLRLNVNGNAGGTNKQNAIRFSVDGDVKAHMGIVVDANRLINGSTANDFCLKGLGSNNILIATNSSERLRIDANGRISVNSNANASDANEGAQLRVTGTPITRNQYYSPAGDYFGSFGYTDNTYTKSWIAVDSSYNKASAVSSGIFLSAFHSDANGSACGHTIKNVRTDAGGLVLSSVHAASSTGNPAVETERLRITTSGAVNLSSPSSSVAAGLLNVPNGSRASTTSGNYVTGNGGVVDMARYEMISRCITAFPANNNAICAINGAPLYINDSRDSWSYYNNLPNYLLGTLTHDCINNSSFSVTLACTMTVFLLRNDGWNSVSLTGWNLIESNTNIGPPGGQTRLYVKTFAAGTHSLDNYSAMYLFSI